jgi:hypothetical protein
MQGINSFACFGLRTKITKRLLSDEALLNKGFYALQVSVRRDKMTPLEIIDLVIGLLCLIDAIMYLLIPTGFFRGWFGFVSKKLKSKSRWTIPFALFLVILVFGYFALQQLTILQIIPGIFIGGLLAKMMLTNYYHDELVPMIKKMSKSIDWLSLAADLLIAVAVFWILFFR